MASATAYLASSRVPDSVTATPKASAFLACEHAVKLPVLAKLSASACRVPLRARWAKAKVSALSRFWWESAWREGLASFWESHGSASA
jgi:hypothetical protein